MCFFLKTNFEFLGFRLTQDGWFITNASICFLQDLPLPSSVNNDGKPMCCGACFLAKPFRLIPEGRQNMQAELAHSERACFLVDGFVFEWSVV